MVGARYQHGYNIVRGRRSLGSNIDLYETFACDPKDSANR